MRRKEQREADEAIAVALKERQEADEAERMYLAEELEAIEAEAKLDHLTIESKR